MTNFEFHENGNLWHCDANRFINIISMALKMNFKFNHYSKPTRYAWWTALCSIQKSLSIVFQNDWFLNISRCSEELSPGKLFIASAAEFGNRIDDYAPLAHWAPTRRFWMMPNPRNTIAFMPMTEMWEFESFIVAIEHFFGASQIQLYVEFPSMHAVGRQMKVWAADWMNSIDVFMGLWA